MLAQATKPCTARAKRCTTFLGKVHGPDRVSYIGAQEMVMEACVLRGAAARRRGHAADCHLPRRATCFSAIPQVPFLDEHLRALDDCGIRRQRGGSRSRCRDSRGCGGSCPAFGARSAALCVGRRPSPRTPRGRRPRGPASARSRGGPSPSPPCSAAIRGRHWRTSGRHRSGRTTAGGAAAGRPAAGCRRLPGVCAGVEQHADRRSWVWSPRKQLRPLVWPVGASRPVDEDRRLSVVVSAGSLFWRTEAEPRFHLYSPR